MKSLSALSLNLPRLDVEETKRIVGGYDWDVYCYGGYYGGVLSGGTCTAYGTHGLGPQHNDWDDYLYHSPFEQFNTPWTGYYDDACGCGSYGYADDGAFDTWDFLHFNFGDSVNAQDRIAIENYISGMPSALQGRSAMIVIDPQYLKTANGGQGANGALIYAGTTSYDGVAHDYDIIVLRDAKEGLYALDEEITHQIQAEECWLQGATRNNTIGAMEFQYAVVDAVAILAGLRDINHSSLKPGIASMSEMLNDCFDRDNNFDINKFVNEFNINKELYYREWGRLSDYPQNVNDRYYDYNWETILGTVVDFAPMVSHGRATMHSVNYAY